MKITLTAWASRRYDPAPSLWVLRRWVREGQIYPVPEMVGNSYYVDEKAERVTNDTLPHGSLVDRLTA